MDKLATTVFVNRDKSTRLFDHKDTKVLHQTATTKDKGKKIPRSKDKDKYKDKDEGFVSQHAENDEETRALFESLLNNCGIEIEKVKKVNRDVKAANVKLTAELESYKENVKAFEFHNKRLSELETGYQNSVSRENFCKSSLIHLMLILSRR